MKKILALFSILLLTGCYTTLKITSSNSGSKAGRYVQSSVADEGDYCYTEKFYTHIYIRDHYIANRVISLPRYRLNCISEPYGNYYTRSYWRYNDGDYYYKEHYHKDDYDYEYGYHDRKNDRSYRPRRGTVGRSTRDGDHRSTDRGFDSRDRNREVRRANSNRSGRERERDRDSENSNS